LPTAIGSLLKPYGKPLIRILPVTAKGSGAIRRRIDWLSFSVLLLIIFGTIAAVLVAAFGPRADAIGVWERIAALFWTLYMLSICGIALLTCFELPYQRNEQRVPVHDRVTVLGAGIARAGILANLSVSGAMVRLETPARLVLGQTLTLNLASVPPLRARVARVAGEGSLIGLAFEPMEDAVRQSLTRRVYLGPEAKPEPVNVRSIPVLLALVRRFWRVDI